MKMQTRWLATGLSMVLSAALAATPALAQTPKRGGTMTYMIPADAPPRMTSFCPPPRNRAPAAETIA